MRSSTVCAALVWGLIVLGGQGARAVDETRLNTQQPRQADTDSGRRDRGPGRALPPDGGAQGEAPDADAAPRVAPGYRVPPGRDREDFRRPRWWLGIYATNTPTGVIVASVVPGSPAARSGLETNDRIVAVNGYQVGYVVGRFYPLGDELQRRADPGGRVTLLVQNWRNNRLLNMDIRLRDQRGWEARPLPARPFRGETESEAPLPVPEPGAEPDFPGPVTPEGSDL